MDLPAAVQPMETVLEAVRRLRTLGFVSDLTAEADGRLRCGACHQVMDTGAVTIVQTVRFEGHSNPDDEAILDAVITPCGHRGLFSAAYGPAVDLRTSEALRLLGTAQPVSLPWPSA